MTSEVWFVPTAAPHAELPGDRAARTRARVHVEHHVDDTHGDRFLIVTNSATAPELQARGARRSTHPAARYWVDARRRTATTSASTASTRSATTSCSPNAPTGSSGCASCALDERRQRTSSRCPTPCTRVWVGANPEYDTRTLRYGYTSLVAPATDVDYDMDTRTATVVKAQPVLGGYDPRRTRPRACGRPARRHARPDLDRAPQGLAARRHRRPALLYGYGSYEISIDPAFRASRLSLLDRGFVFAIAHVRGGGELGRALVRGRPARAQGNTFTDFIALRRGPRRRGLHRRPAGSSRAAGAPAGC